MGAPIVLTKRHPILPGTSDRKGYHSTVFEPPAQDIWKIIRDFNNYPVWVAGAGESRIEDGKSGRHRRRRQNILYRGRQIRQRLLAQSEGERSQTYKFSETPTLPMTGFQATLRSWFGKWLESNANRWRQA